MGNIKSKIQKLLTLANDKGASEDEAATAMRMAMGLMMKHGIEQKDLGGDVPRAKRGSHLKATFQKYQIILAMAAADLYGCRVLFYNGGKEGLLFVGRQDNIDASEQMLIWLTQQVERLYKTDLRRGMTQRERGEFRKTFKWACASRVAVRVSQLVKEMQQSDASAKEATGSNALVVLGHYRTLLDEAEQAIGDVRKRAITGHYGSGSNQGHAAGDKVQLRHTVSGTRRQLT